MGKAPLSRALRKIKQLLREQSLFLYYIKQIDSMLPCICPVIDHRGRQNVVRTPVTHSAIASCATFLFLPHFDVICDLLLDRYTATWNLFVNLMILLPVHFLRRGECEYKIRTKVISGFDKLLVSKKLHLSKKSKPFSTLKCSYLYIGIEITCTVL